METGRPLTADARVLLVEGESDRVLVEALLARSGVSAEVIPMGGATNVRRFAAEYPGAIGLCDIQEERFFARTLERWFVCDPDLEGELIRALGVEGVEAVLAEQGELASFRTLQQMPDQRGRPPQQQLLGSSADDPATRCATRRGCSRHCRTRGCRGCCSTWSGRSRPERTGRHPRPTVEILIYP